MCQKHKYKVVPAIKEFVRLEATKTETIKCTRAVMEACAVIVPVMNSLSELISFVIISSLVFIFELLSVYKFTIFVGL